MIVNKNDKGWDIIFHRAHALLAFKIGINIKESLWPLPGYRLEGLTAITEHDNCQPTWRKKDNLTKSGAPLDFRLPSELVLKKVKEMISHCLHKSAFMTLMVSMHCRSIYREKKRKDIQQFLNEQEILCKSIREHLGITIKDAELCYKIIRFCDELSLLLCQGDIPKMERKIQVEPLPGIDENFIRKDEEGFLRLDHWCFTSSEFKLTTEYYQTKKLSYDSDNELISELPMGNPSTVDFRFKEG